MSKRAVFLDRDKTIIADPGYIDDPDLVRLLPGAAAGIRRLNDAGYAVVIATNQSGVARGRVTEEQLGEIHERLREMVLEQGARIDAIYYCPYLDGPEAVVEDYRQASDLRKPEPGMLLRAAEELELSLADSWMIGDSPRDIIAGSRAGCRTVLIDPKGEISRNGDCEPDFIVRSLLEAADLVIEDPHPPPRPKPKPAVAIESGVGRAADATATATASTASSPGAPDKVVVSLPASASRPSAYDEESLALLREIRDLLRRSERKGRQEDFSVARLMATLTQMLALVAGAWAVVALFNNLAEAPGRFGLAILLQALTITALFAGSRR